MITTTETRSQARSTDQKERKTWTHPRQCNLPTSQGMDLPTNWKGYTGKEDHLQPLLIVTILYPW